MPITPTRAALDELYLAGLDLWDVQEILQDGHDYRPRGGDTREAFLIISGCVRKVVVMIREDHVLLVEVKLWRPRTGVIRELRRKQGISPREVDDAPQEN